MDKIDKNYHTIEECRISNSKDLTKVLDLGLQPLANSLKKKQYEDENKYPLTLSYCEKSSLLQLNETINKEILFDKYVWVSSTSSTAKNYANTFFSNITQNIQLQKNNDLIIKEGYYITNNKCINKIEINHNFSFFIFTHLFQLNELLEIMLLINL